jgi:hypothetical protein
VKRHLGCFAINIKLLEDMPEVLMKDLFSKMLIIRAEHMLDRNAILYIAYSPEHFPELVAEGSKAPLYMVQINEFGDLSMVKLDE